MIDIVKLRKWHRKLPAQHHKPRGGSTYHKFTEEESSNGGANARYIERVQGRRLNHGVTFGKRDYQL